MGVEYSIADMRVVDSSHNHTVRADLKGGPLPAFKRHGSFCDPGRHYGYRFSSRKACDGEFRFSVRKAGRGSDHFIGECFVGNIDDKLPVVPDVPGGVLGDSRPLVSRCKGNDRGA